MDFGIKGFSTQSITPGVTGESGKSTQIVDQDPASIIESFAKVLIAQMQNQDPDAPMDPTQIVSQYAQMMSSLGVARMTNHMAHYELVDIARSVVSKKIEYTDKDGAVQMGIVEGADYTMDTPHVFVNNELVPVKNIQTIHMI